jgi:hypothetical protein
MVTKLDSSQVSYVPGLDTESQEANRRYQEAMQKLVDSLEARRKPLFDPMFLALARGAGTPTRTGGWGESLGNIATELGKAQTEQQGVETELANMKMQLAGMGLQQQQLKQRERAFDAALGLPGAPAALGAAPGQGSTQATSGEAPPGFQGVPGTPLLPPNPRVLTGTSYLSAARQDPKKSAADAIKEAQEIERKRYETKEGGVLDLSTGLFYAFPKGELVERQIYGSTYKIPAASASILDLYQSTSDPRYHDVASKLLGGVPRTGAGGKAPEGGTAGQPLKSVRESEVEREMEVSRAKKLAEAAAAKEAEIETRDATARRMYSNATQIQSLVAKSPQAFGIFNRPGLLASLGNLISRGMQTPTGTVNLAGFEDSVRQAMPNISQADLNNVMMAAGALAEVELAYTQLYMAKQGAITEGEREVVRRIGGNVSQSPDVLMAKAKLIQMRSQHDMDVAEGFRQFQERNPAGNYLQYEKSPLYRDIRKDFETNLARAFGGSAALPSSQRSGARNNAAAAQRLEQATGGGK